MSEKTNSSGTFRKHWLRQDAFSWIFRVGAVKVTGRDVIILWASAETAQQPVTTVWLASSKDLLVKPAIKHVQNAEMKGATAGIIRETTVAKWADEATGYKPDATLTRIIRLKASGSGFTMGPWKLARRARDIAGALPGPAAKSRAFIVELL